MSTRSLPGNREPWTHLKCQRCVPHSCPLCSVYILIRSQYHTGNSHDMTPDDLSCINKDNVTLHRTNADDSPNHPSTHTPPLHTHTHTNHFLSHSLTPGCSSIALSLTNTSSPPLSLSPLSPQGDSSPGLTSVVAGMLLGHHSGNSTWSTSTVCFSLHSQGTGSPHFQWKDDIIFYSQRVCTYYASIDSEIGRAHV